MTNKVIRDKSRCSECLSDKLRFLKETHNKEVVIDIIKHADLLFKVQRKRKKYRCKNNEN